ncbi:MAG: AprI/Inh family metalloprotease inhibitor [Pseudorhodoplanes sp.]
MRAAVAALFIVFASAAPLRAEALPDNAKGLVGAWEISNSDRDRICTVAFKPDAAPGGMKIELDKGCGSVFPALRDVTAWALTNDYLLLLDSRRQTVLQFGEVENGMYEAERAGEGLYFLQSAAAAAPPPRTVEQIAGEWTFVRNENTAICAVTLTPNPVAGQDGFALRLKPPCDPVVTRFNPTAWRMNLGELVLEGRGESTWRFEEEDPNSWRRVPESADPLLLVRK